MTFKQQLFNALWMGGIVGIGFVIPDLILNKIDRADIAVPLATIFTAFMVLNHFSRKI